MRTKHKSTVLLFSCPISYSNMYWFEFAVSLPKKQSPFIKGCQTFHKTAKQNLTHTHTLSLSLSKLRQRSHGFSFSSDLTLFFARCIGSQHEAKEDPPIVMPHSSSSSPVTYLPVHITFPSFFSLVSRESWRNQYINLSLFFLTSLFLLAWISSFLSAKLSLFRCFAAVLGFRVGLKLELGVGLKLEGSFPFLNWWCLVVQKGIEN